MLSDLSRVRKETEAYENVGVDHEYEILDKYSQPYEIPVAPPPKQEQHQKSSPAAGGDYELTQCPAYVPVITTGIHGNRHNTSSRQHPT